MVREKSAIDRQKKDIAKKAKNNLLDKYFKGQKKKEQTKIYEIWPNITVKQLAGKKTF